MGEIDGCVFSEVQCEAGGDAGAEGCPIDQIRRGLESIRIAWLTRYVDAHSAIWPAHRRAQPDEPPVTVEPRYSPARKTIDRAEVPTD